jgi:integrase
VAKPSRRDIEDALYSADREVSSAAPSLGAPRCAKIGRWLLLSAGLAGAETGRVRRGRSRCVSGADEPLSQHGGGRGQLWGLKWSDVDLAGSEITVYDNRVVVAGHAFDKAGGKTKNADQTIAIDRATASALSRWRGVQDRERDFFGADYHAGDYVFTFEDGRPPHPDSIRQRFDRLAAAARLSRITFHDLRHSYATGAR